MGRRLVFAAAALALAALSAAAEPALKADVARSPAAPRAQPAPITWRLGYRPPMSPVERGTIGAGAGLSEGKPLEMLWWGSAGAVAGSLAGPLGAALGGAAGAAIGLCVSLFATPKTVR